MASCLLKSCTDCCGSHQQGKCATAGGLICVLWFGARLVVEGKLSPGELSTFVIYAVYVGSNVGALAGIVSSLVQVTSATCVCTAPSSLIEPYQA